jgi:hypothetical protein
MGTSGNPFHQLLAFQTHPCLMVTSLLLLVISLAVAVMFNTKQEQPLLTLDLSTVAMGSLIPRTSLAFILFLSLREELGVQASSMPTSLVFRPKDDKPFLQRLSHPPHHFQTPNHHHAPLRALS